MGVVIHDPCAGGCGCDSTALLEAILALLRSDHAWYRGPGVAMGMYDYNVESVALAPKVYARLVYYYRHGKPPEGEDYDDAKLRGVYEELGWPFDAVESS